MRARYLDAIDWIAGNDDTRWLSDPPPDLDDPTPVLSVTAALVADLFGKRDAQVIADLKKALRRMGREA